MPQTPGFRSAKQILVASFATQTRACILSDHKTFYTPRGGKTTAGSNASGAFLVFLSSGSRAPLPTRNKKVSPYYCLNKHYPPEWTVFVGLFARLALATRTAVCLFAAVVTGTRLGVALSPVVVVVISPALITLNAAAMVTIRLQGNKKVRNVTWVTMLGVVHKLAAFKVTEKLRQTLCFTSPPTQHHSFFRNYLVYNKQIGKTVYALFISKKK